MFRKRCELIKVDVISQKRAGLVEFYRSFQRLRVRSGESTTFAIPVVRPSSLQLRPHHSGLTQPQVWTMFDETWFTNGAKGSNWNSLAVVVVVVVPDILSTCKTKG